MFVLRMPGEVRWLRGSSISDMHQKAIEQSVLEPDLFLKSTLLQYLTAQITGALIASVFVMYVIGTEASLGTNAPDYSYPLPLVFGIEVLYSHDDGSHLLGSLYQELVEARRSGYRSDGRS